MNFKLIIGVLASGVLVSSAMAQKMYKVVGEDGSISYQDTLPDADSSRIQERHVNSNSNGLSSTAPVRPAQAEAEQLDPDADPDQDPRQSALAEDAVADDAVVDGNATRKQSSPSTASDADEKAQQGQARRSAEEAEEDGDIVYLEEGDEAPDKPAGSQARRAAADNAANTDRADASEDAIAESEIKILKESRPTVKRRDSRGRRPAPPEQSNKRLTTEELAEIARSLENK